VVTLEERVEAPVDGSTGGGEMEVKVSTGTDANVEVDVDIEVEVVVSSFVSNELDVEVEVRVEVTPPLVAEVEGSTIVDVEVESSTTVLKEVKREVTVPPGRRLIPPGPSQSSLSKQHFGCPFVPNPAQYVPGWHPTSSAMQHVYELGMQNRPQYSRPWPQNCCRANTGALLAQVSDAVSRGRMRAALSMMGIVMPVEAASPIDVELLQVE
jgi:hypothetical protein